MAPTFVITNKFNARLVTCEQHEAEQSALIYGLMPETRRQADALDGECRLCREARQWVELPGRVREALTDPRCTHTRARSWCRSNSIYIYHRDHTSPSGVKLAVSCPEEMFNPIYSELLAAGKLSSSKSPLSPTEGLGGR